MNTVTLKRDGKVTEVSTKWRERFLKDGWKADGEEAPRPNTEYTGQAAQEISREDLVDLVNGSQTKDQLEALIKDAFGVDLDKRKGLDKLKAEALELANEG